MKYYYYCNCIGTTKRHTAAYHETKIDENEACILCGHYAIILKDKPETNNDIYYLSRGYVKDNVDNKTAYSNEYSRKRRKKLKGE